MRLRLIRFNRQYAQRGDTLVEVLISIAIISTILSGAYVVANRSLIATRESQERGNALKLAQGQVERIKTIASSTTVAGLFDPANSSYCINNNNNIVASGDTACNVNAQGVPSSTEPVYHLVARRSGNVFTVTTTWASLKSTVPNKVTIDYKVYQ